jgi:hypothetical protein
MFSRYPEKLLLIRFKINDLWPFTISFTQYNLTKDTSMSYNVKRQIQERPFSDYSSLKLRNKWRYRYTNPQSILEFTCEIYLDYFACSQNLNKLNDSTVFYAT